MFELLVCLFVLFFGSNKVVVYCGCVGVGDDDIGWEVFVVC